MWLEQNCLVRLFCLVFLIQISVTKNTKLLICYSISSDIKYVIHQLQYVFRHSRLKQHCPSEKLSGEYLNSSCSSLILSLIFFQIDELCVRCLPGRMFSLHSLLCRCDAFVKFVIINKPLLQKMTV